jgi:hypothetical protein
MSIESTLQSYKEWYWQNWNLCLFCNHSVKRHGDLAHLIRRSSSIRLQTLKLNTGLAHRECHDIFDNKPGEAVFLPRFYECMYLIFLMDSQYFNQMVGTVYPDVWLPDFFEISRFIPYPEHHGELLTLQHFLNQKIVYLPQSGSPLLPVLQADHSPKQEKQLPPGPVVS